MRIGVDIDGVLADYHSEYIAFHNQKYGTKFTPADIRHNHFIQAFGKTDEEAYHLMKEFNHTHLETLPILEGAKRAIFKLAETHDLYVITARHPSLKGKTDAWLTTHFGNVFEEAISSLYTHAGETILPKWKICHEKNISCMIEDKLVTAVECAENNINTFLINREWNQSETLPPRVQRVYSWDEIVKRLS